MLTVYYHMCFILSTILRNIFIFSFYYLSVFKLCVFYIQICIFNWKFKMQKHGKNPDNTVPSSLRFHRFPPLPAHMSCALLQLLTQQPRRDFEASTESHCRCSAVLRYCGILPVWTVPEPHGHIWMLDRCPSGSCNTPCWLGSPDPLRNSLCQRTGCRCNTLHWNREKSTGKKHVTKFPQNFKNGKISYKFYWFYWVIMYNTKLGKKEFFLTIL